tara:strand:- start:510 stop:806 length:297 start_codon:yes stop_codon:yes gene_type:complete
MALFSGDIGVVKMANGFLFIATALLLYHLFNTIGDSAHLAFIAALFTLANGHMLRSSTIIMSEIPFLFFSLLTLLLFIRVGDATDLKSACKTPIPTYI